MGTKVDSSRIRIRITAPQVYAAIPFLVVAVLFLLAIAAFLQGSQRLTPELRSMSCWPGYEVLAAFFSFLLPFSSMLTEVARKLDLPLARSRNSRRFVQIALILPFFVIAWCMAGSLFGSGWFLLGFGLFTVSHLISFESRWPTLKDKVSPVRKSIFDALKCYGMATLAFLLSAFIWVLPLDLLGPELKGSDVRQSFLLVTIGATYFCLLAICELLDFDSIYAQLRARMDAGRQALLEAVRQKENEERLQRRS